MPSHSTGESTSIRGSLETPVPVTALLALLEVLLQLHLKCCHCPVRSQACPNPVLIQSQSRTNPVQIWSDLSSIHLFMPCQAQGQQGRCPSSMSSAMLLPRLRLAAPGLL